MRGAAIGGSAGVATVPVVWDFLGYHFQAGPLVVTVCCALVTRLIISLNHQSRHKWVLDGLVTCLSVVVSALWTQANSLGLLPAGISGIAIGAIGIGIIAMAKSQFGMAFRMAVQTFFRTAAAPPPADKDDDLLKRIDAADEEHRRR